MANTLHGKNPRTNRTPKTRARFLSALKETCNVTESCKISRLAHTSAYEWRDEDKDFRQEWDAALQIGADVLEDEAVRRAKEGVSEPVYQGGKLVGNVQKYSDTLLIFLLKGAKPDKYAEKRQLEHSGKMTLEQLVCGDSDEEPEPSQDTRE